MILKEKIKEGFAGSSSPPPKLLMHIFQFAFIGHHGESVDPESDQPLASGSEWMSPSISFWLFTDIDASAIRFVVVEGAGGFW